MNLENEVRERERERGHMTRGEIKSQTQKSFKNKKKTKRKVHKIKNRHRRARKLLISVKAEPIRSLRFCSWKDEKWPDKWKQMRSNIPPSTSKLSKFWSTDLDNKVIEGQKKQSKFILCWNTRRKSKSNGLKWPARNLRRFEKIFYLAMSDGILRKIDKNLVNRFG